MLRRNSIYLTLLSGNISITCVEMEGFESRILPSSFTILDKPLIILVYRFGYYKSQTRRTTTDTMWKFHAAATHSLSQPSTRSALSSQHFTSIAGSMAHSKDCGGEELACGVEMVTLVLCASSSVIKSAQISASWKPSRRPFAACNSSTATSRICARCVFKARRRMGVMMPRCKEKLRSPVCDLSGSACIGVDMTSRASWICSSATSSNEGAKAFRSS